MTADRRERIHRRTLAVVVISQAFGGAGLAAGISVGALIAQDMMGTESLSGLPTALFTLGAALAAFLVGRVTQHVGRRIGLGLGFTAGGLGAVGVVIATQLGSPALLFTALFVYGAGTATNLQARYAGTDLASPERKGTAVSVAMVATAIGAIAGPNLIGPLGGLATNLGLPALTGPFLLAAVAYLLAGAVLFTMLRPDPFLLARQLENQAPAALDADAAHAADEQGSSDSGSDGLPRLVLVGALVMVISQFVMVAVMTMTPVHMRAHDHSMGAVGLVIGLHIGAMWLPSLVTGLLVDATGPRPTAISSGSILLAAGVTAALAPDDSLTALIIALVLLGLGWNFGLVAGTTMVVKGTRPATRASTQGSIDVWVNVFGAGAGAVSGVLMHAAGFSVLAIAGGIVALIIIPALALAPRAGR
ncbi:MFS transporter [Dietzia lutea]|uniref:MFS transporter n=2 Tax=Dietzia lutea TaxID=546160 RepID=A0A2S1RBL3_9ACTN|nr:MFS transporter [Dietzia lutea]AWH93652.1 MFS transporter [Dietzia lutea]